MLVELAEQILEGALGTGGEHVAGQKDLEHTAVDHGVERLFAEEANGPEAIGRAPAFARFEDDGQLVRARKQPAAAGRGGLQAEYQPKGMIGVGRRFGARGGWLLRVVPVVGVALARAVT